MVGYDFPIGPDDVAAICKVPNLRPIHVGQTIPFLQQKIWRCASTDLLGRRDVDYGADDGFSSEPLNGNYNDDIILKHAELVIDLRHSRERDDELARAWMDDAGMRLVTYDPKSDNNEYMMGRTSGRTHERTVLQIDVLSPSRLVDFVVKQNMMQKHKRGGGVLARTRSWTSAASGSRRSGKSSSKQQKRQLVMEWMKKRGVAGLNQAVFECGKDELCFVLKEITKTAQSGGTVVLSCVQGKDRTGCLALLVQSCLDLPDEIIVDDYHMSEAFLRKQHQQTAQATARQARARFFNRSSNKFVGRAPKEAMVHVLAYLRRRYGSIEGYMDTIGFDKSWRLRLKDAILEGSHQQTTREL